LWYCWISRTWNFRYDWTWICSWLVDFRRLNIWNGDRQASFYAWKPSKTWPAYPLRQNHLSKCRTSWYPNVGRTERHNNKTFKQRSIPTTWFYQWCRRYCKSPLVQRFGLVIFNGQDNTTSFSARYGICQK